MNMFIFRCKNVCEFKYEVLPQTNWVGREVIDEVLPQTSWVGREVIDGMFTVLLRLAMMVAARGRVIMELFQGAILGKLKAWLGS